MGKPIDTNAGTANNANNSKAAKGAAAVQMAGMIASDIGNIAGAIKNGGSTDPSVAIKGDSSMDPIARFAMDITGKSTKNAINNLNSKTVNFRDNSTSDLLNSWSKVYAPTKQNVKGQKWHSIFYSPGGTTKEGIVDNLLASGQGAVKGTQYGGFGWGTLIGGIAGGLFNWGSRLGMKKRADKYNKAVDNYYAQTLANANNAANNLSERNKLNQWANYSAYGGPLKRNNNMNNNIFSYGGMMPSLGGGAMSYDLANTKLNTAYLQANNNTRITSMPNSFSVPKMFAEGGSMDPAMMGGGMPPQGGMPMGVGMDPNMQLPGAGAMGDPYMQGMASQQAPVAPSNGVTNIEEGGTHEENPNGGVPIGVDNEGNPNLAEEGEVVYKDFVFSDRIIVKKEVKEELKLKGPKNMTYADAANQLQAESEERPNDPISSAGLDAMMDRLSEFQELQKQEEELMAESYAEDEINAENEIQDAEETVGPLDPSAQENNMMQQATPESELAQDPSMMGGGMPMDPSMMGGGGMPMDPSMMMGGAGSPPMMAFGGHIRRPNFFTGGTQDKNNPKQDTSSTTDKKDFTYKYLNAPFSSNKNLLTGAKMHNFGEVRKPFSEASLGVDTSFTEPIDFLDTKSKLLSPTEIKLRHRINYALLQDRMNRDKKRRAKKAESSGNPSDNTNEDWLAEMFKEGQKYSKAPIYGSILGSIMAAGEPEEYANTDLIRMAAERAAAPISAVTNGTKLAYNPLSVYSQIQAINNNALANNRSYGNMANGNSNALRNALLASQYANNIAIGDARAKALEYNNALLQGITQSNNALDQANADRLMQAAASNQQARGHLLTGAAQEAAMREEIRMGKKNSMYNNLSNIFTNMGKYGEGLQNYSTAIKGAQYSAPLNSDWLNFLGLK